MKVLFLNPVVDKMKPCEHFLNLSCKFEDNCKFSHGELIKFSTIKSYQDPNYSLLKKRCHILIKTESSLWKPGTILEISEKLRTCQVKLQNSGKMFDCPFSDILPPIDSDSDSSDLSSDEDYDEDSCTTRNAFFRLKITSESGKSLRLDSDRECYRSSDMWKVKGLEKVSLLIYIFI